MIINDYHRHYVHEIFRPWIKIIMHVIIRVTRFELQRLRRRTLHAIIPLACDKLKLNCAVDDAVDLRLSLVRFWESNFNKRDVGKYESTRSRDRLYELVLLLSTYVLLCLQRVNDRFSHVSCR